MDLHNFIKSKVWLNFIICTYFLQLVLSGEEPRYESCKPRSCGIGPNVSYPFFIVGNGTNFCGHPRFGIQCEGGRPIYKTSGPEYILESIDYQNQSFVLVRRELSNSTCPKPLMNFAFDQSFLKFPPNRANLVFFYNCAESFTVNFPKSLVTCDDPPTEKKTYIVLIPLYGEAVWKNSTCEGVVSTPVQLDSGKENQTAVDIDYKKKLKDGFGMQWAGLEFDCGACETSGGQCGFDSGSSICYCSDGSSHPNNCNKGYNRLGLKLGLGITFAAFGALMFIGFLFRDSIISCLLSLCCGKGRREDHNIEDFLEHCGPLTPKRYTYLEVKKITKSFKDKLGKGGYGEVFKGNLPDGSLVAVKVLVKSKTNGEAFINEVASIGRTSHVNIVTLLGFCFEGSKRALIYEFMSRGSLDKYIYEENCSMHDRRLGWQTLFEIAIGIARGLEYLHRGCKTRILHFDIKPHNILLDENFCPKIADFGLAKICPKRESVISMMGARGTAGYIAPEVFCRTIGGVSHKSDVYSYGMLVFEMVGGRKNVCVDVENTSETYFPEWIHKHLELGEDLGLCGTGTDEEIQLARKMILVSLLCIQTNPSDRPPMDKVVEMLQGSLEYIPFSPKPYWSSPCITVQSSVTNSASALIVTS